MANTTTSLFHTLLAAVSDASTHLRYQNAFFDRIYWDYQPVVAIPYQTLNVTIPTVSEGDVVDIGGGPLNPTDTRHDSVAITLDKHFSSSFIIKNWDVIRTPADLKAKYIAPRLEALKRKMNRSIAELVTTTNFPTHTLISGAGTDVFQRADIAGAWGNLANVGVPVDDSANLSLITNVTAYSKMLAATEFVNESIVGVSAAVAAQQRAVMEPQFGARVLFDQHITAYNAGKQPGIFMHRYAIAGVTANPAPSDSTIMETVVDLGGIPVQIQMQSSLRDQGTLIHMHCFWGVKVVRDNFGSLLQTD